MNTMLLAPGRTYGPPGVHPNLPTPPLGLEELSRISVRDAAKNPPQPISTYKAIVQLVEIIPELGMWYVQDEQGTRFMVDRDTRLHTELKPGTAYRALVTVEGYAVALRDLNSDFNARPA